MTSTVGQVQELKINTARVALVFIGPSPSDVEVLKVTIPSSASVKEAALSVSKITTLMSCLGTTLTVTAIHDDNGTEIQRLLVESNE